MRLLIVLAKCMGGGLLVLTGIALVPLPGPGIPVILLGLAVLGTEFAWAARLQEWLAGLVRRGWERATGVVSPYRAT